uniref:Uncharacterized protein n=1 Tax=Arundo donax TaxID=35708 RepID=A0A0A9BVK3_ARUDO
MKSLRCQVAAFRSQRCIHYRKDDRQ